MKMEKIWNTSLTLNNVNELVSLYGWVARKRDLGGLLFIDLRDRSGIIQLVIRPESECYETALSLKNEYVIKAIGKVVQREKKNEELKTGEIEIDVTELNVINQSKELPFSLTEYTNALEDTRLKYRYLDIRRNEIKEKIITRHKIMQIIRNFLSIEDYIEV